MSSFYHINLAVLAAGNAFLLYKRYGPGGQQKKAAQQAENASANGNGHSKQTSSPEKDEDDVESARTSLDSNTPTSSHSSNLLSTPDAAAQAQARKFQIEYFAVYILAVAADWLQGPHIYAIYKYEKQIPERLVAALYAAGFIAGAVSASIAGNLADRYGRRLACMVYCASTALACLSMLSNNLIVLSLGRLCGGVSTTLLFSVFEAWMISEYRTRGLQASGLALGDIFGLMTTLSCIAAIVSGIVGEVLVAQLGGRVWPFLAAALCATAAAYLILTTWRENYGAKSAGGSGATTTSILSGGIISGLADIINTVRIIVRHAGILSLGIASCVFEGTMYLVVFFWSAALQSARAKAGGALADQQLPFGIIFSSFMCAMMAGGTLFSLRNVTTRSQTSMFDNAGFLLAGVVLLVSMSLSLAVVASTSEALIFWAVCIIEACIGIYYPSMSLLKSEVVEDDVRGRVYSLLRMPLNVFVVVAHALDEEGDGHRNRVFLTLAGLLMASFFVVKRNIISA